MKNIIKKALLFTLCAVLLLQLAGVSFAEAKPPSGLRWGAFYAYGFRVYRDAECTELIENASELRDIPVGETLYYKKICEDGRWILAMYIDDTPSFTENSFVLTQEHKDKGYVYFQYHEVLAGNFYLSDNSVNIKDVMWILRSIGGRYPNEINEEAGDYNCDGKVNVKDVQAILRLIAGEESTYGGLQTDFEVVAFEKGYWNKLLNGEQ